MTNHSPRNWLPLLGLAAATVLSAAAEVHAQPASPREAAARKGVERERAAAQGEVERLSVKIADLNGEVESLRDSVSHLGESLANALAAK